MNRIKQTLTFLLIVIFLPSYCQVTYVDIDYSIVQKLGNDSNWILRAGSGYTMSFYHVDYTYQCADGKKSWKYSEGDDNYVLVITDSYGQAPTPYLASSIVSLRVEANSNKIFKLMDFSFWNWIQNFVVTYNISNTSPNAVFDWYNNVASIDEKQILDDRVRSYGPEDFTTLYNNCIVSLRSLTRHDPWSIIFEVGQSYNQNERFVIGANKLPANGNNGSAFRYIGFLKYISNVIIDDTGSIMNTSYSSKKYFKCYETVVKSWPAPALQQIIPENSTVQADEILSVDPITDVEKYIFRLYDLNGNEIVMKEDTVSQFDLSEVVGQIVYDSTYLLEVSSKIGTSEGPRSQQLPIRISDIVQDNYYSIGTGNWKDPNVWSKSPGGLPSGFIPKKEDVIHINGHMITLTDSAECDVVNVYSSDISSSELLIDGGALKVNSQIEIDDTAKDYMGYVKVKNNGALLVKEIEE